MGKIIDFYKAVSRLPEKQLRFRMKPSSVSVDVNIGACKCGNARFIVRLGNPFTLECDLCFKTICDVTLESLSATT